MGFTIPWYIVEVRKNNSVLFKIDSSVDKNSVSRIFNKILSVQCKGSVHSCLNMSIEELLTLWTPSISLTSLWGKVTSLSYL